MIHFENSRVVNFEDLAQVVDDDGKRVYTESLLQEIKSGDFNALNEINLSDRNNKFFMEPLLFAVKNSEFSTYEVFRYYGEELQKQDLTMATEIVINEPEVMEDTVITDNPTLVLHFSKLNPEIILYISEDLKNDGEFIEELCETGNKEAIMYAVRECNIATVIQDNPELASNPVFMKEAIKEDATLLTHASEELKNDREFMQSVCKENKEAINYVVEHTDEFGKDALNAAKDSLEERLLIETKKEVEDGRTKLETEKEKLTPEQVKRKERDLNSIEKMIKRFEEAETPEKKGKIAHLILVTTGMEQYQNMDEYSNGVVHEKMDPEFRNELEKYEKLYIAAQEKEKTEKKITPEQIEEKTGKARISEINGEAQGIKEEYIKATNEKEVGREDESVGDEARS